MKIIKRSGVEVFFDSNKIVAAVQPIMWKWHVKT